MAKLTDLSLDELYSRNITSSVMTVIRQKDDFNQRSQNWCDNVCTRKCKNIPPDDVLVPSDQVDVLFIQDYKAFDEPKFWKKGAAIEAKHVQILQYMANRALKRSDGSPITYDITTLSKCQIQSGDLVRGKAPSDTVLQKCSPYLFAEIARRKPKAIVSLSTVVSKVLGFKKSNFTNRGEILQNELGIPVIITGHPRILVMLRQNASGAMWGPDFYSAIFRDLEKTAGIVEGTIPVPDLKRGLAKVKRDIFIARNLDDVKDYVKELYESKAVLSFDTETTSLDPYAPEAKLITIQFGKRHPETKVVESFVFPMWHRANKWYNPNEAWKIIEPLISDPNVKLIGHNIKFDILYTTTTTGVRPQGVLFDTMLLLHAINSGVQGMYGLKKAVHDWLPEMELGNYEDELPSLSKAKDLIEEAEEEIEE